MKHICAAAILAFATIGAHAGILATTNINSGPGVAQVALTDTRCKGGPAPYDSNRIPVAGTAMIASAGDKDTGCWTAPIGATEVEVEWSDGLVGHYAIADLRRTNYGSAHGF
jgi:hypothetical protein